MHAAAKWLNALSTGSPRQPAEFHRPLTSLADYLFALPSFPTSLPPSLHASSAPIPPLQQLRGSGDVGARRSEREAWKERLAASERGDVREKRQICCRAEQRASERGEKNEIKISSFSQHSLTMTLGESFRSNEPENAEPPLPFILPSTTLSHHRATIAFISERKAPA